VAAKKRLNKSQLREDKFIDTVAHYAGMLREHQRSIIGGLAVVLILILAVSWGVRYVNESDEESRVAFSGALGELDLAIQDNLPDGYEAALQSFEAIHSQFSGKTAGRWSIYYTGFCKEQLKNFQGALDDFDAYIASGDPEFELAAQQGRASCLHSLGKIRAAAEALETLAERPGSSEDMVRGWLYRASKIYFTGQYFESADNALTKLEAMGAGSYEVKMKRDQAALAALRS
jgi:tetratricopeptide (TPR) repeat protein